MKFDSNGLSQLDSNGSWDNAGLLCGYDCTKTGSFVTRFGVKDKGANKCTKTAAGKYTFTHNLGHRNYTVQITSQDVGAMPYIVTKELDYIYIEFRNVNNNLVDRSFMIQFFGNM